MSENKKATDEQEIKFRIKLANVQKRVGIISKDSKNPLYNSSYAKLPDIMKQLLPILEEEKLHLSFSKETNGSIKVLGAVVNDLESTLTHKVNMPLSNYKVNTTTNSERSGKTISKNEEYFDTQKTVAECTYLKRELIGDLFGLVLSEDDDGNLASGKIKRKVSKKVSNEDF